MTRKVYNQVPPKVEYSLSEYGESLGDVLDILCLWGESHTKHLVDQGKNVTLLCNN